ncbi:MAG: PHB depolymerase family esterase [Nevskia sp.]|nr:PHB depolymerase family esterase [Nevskia sp.]
MRLRIIRDALALAALFGCGAYAAPVFQSPTDAAIASSGPGTTDAAQCAVPYGDPPRPLPSPLSVSGDLGAVLNLLNACLLKGGAPMSWTDSQKEQRHACVFVPPGTTAQAPLPLVVFLQGSLFPAPPQLILNDWVPLTRSVDLSADPAKPGFILLLPIGRNTAHFYPFPDNDGLGWDNWYRNLDRSSPDLNLDVAAIDHFIAAVEAGGIVDTNRVYLTGWSNGAAMAQLYALNTPSVAAAAVYSSPDPFRDVQDPCAQTPFATTMTPLMDIHNACDIVGICQTGTKFHQDLAKLYPNLPQYPVIVNSNKFPVQACNASCANQTLANVGDLNHLLWPQTWNDAMFEWLRDHPLDAKH